MSEVGTTFGPAATVILLGYSGLTFDSALCGTITLPVAGSQL